MTPKIHAAAGGLALITIATFWSGTLLVEVIGTHSQIGWVKTAVLWGMLVLIPAMATAGASGAVLAKRMKGPLIAVKQRRMKFIAANGLLILLPSAVFLALRASTGHFDAIFYTVQTVELLAGAANITLLSLNMRDGLALRNRRQKAL
ncbi:MAG: hypothetical protein ABJZ79_18765 [Parasphingorhabdus sp.]|uniref:hypothetical protein n=1 Tax=Parasphingorhabdus sp. TaxID=2709688 RepID=UPI00329A5382